MALKKVAKTNKPTTNSNDRISEINKSLVDIGLQINTLNTERRKLQEELLSIKIAPFKIGEYALAEVSSGRSKKWQKCLLECEDGILYVRPVKDNGELSGRHFSIYPWSGQTYADFLKEVE